MFLGISPATLIIGLIVLVLAVLAIRRLMKRGTCDCHGAKDDSCAGCCSACAQGRAAGKEASSCDCSVKKAHVLH